MSEMLGLLDAMESIVLEAKKIPFTENIVIEERKIIDLIDKLRMTIKSNGNIVRQSVDINEEIITAETNVGDIQIKKNESISYDKTVEEAKKVKDGANEYADYILTSLQLTVTKMQNNLIKLEKNIESGRNIINKNETAENNNQVEESIQ